VKEIVQQILETEKEVRESIEKAHADAQTIVRDAERKSREVDERVRQKAIREAQEIAERMKQETETERQRQIASAQGARSELLKRKSVEIKTATERVVNLILGIQRR
jgi:vacuolar-type H+-ATPase subunit H